MHHISRALILITLITLQLPSPTTASPISKRFIPIIIPTTFSTSSFHPLVDSHRPQPSNTDFTLHSEPRPEDCKAICGVKKRALLLPSEPPTAVTVSGRWITETRDSNPSPLERSTDTPKEPSTQTIHDFNARTKQDVSPSDPCDCTNLNLANELKTYILGEIAKQNSTATATSTSTSTTTTPHPQPAQTKNLKTPLDNLTPRKISAMAIGSCILLFLLLLSAFIIYRIIKSKREDKEKEKGQRKSSLYLNFDAGGMGENIPSFPAAGGATAASESREVLVMGVGKLGMDEVVVEVGEVGLKGEEIGLQDGVRVSQVGLAR